jgi:hypothetical protein
MIFWFNKICININWMMLVIWKLTVLVQENPGLGLWAGWGNRKVRGLNRGGMEVQQNELAINDLSAMFSDP